MFFFPLICGPAPHYQQRALQVTDLIQTTGGFSNYVSISLLHSSAFSQVHCSFLFTCSIYVWPSETPLTHFFSNSLSLLCWFPFLYQSIISEIEVNNQKKLYCCFLTVYFYAFFPQNTGYFWQNATVGLLNNESERFMYFHHQSSTIKVHIMHFIWCHSL